MDDDTWQSGGTWDRRKELDFAARMGHLLVLVVQLPDQVNQLNHEA